MRLEKEEDQKSVSKSEFYYYLIGSYGRYVLGYDIKKCLPSISVRRFVMEWLDLNGDKVGEIKSHMISWFNKDINVYNFLKTIVSNNQNVYSFVHGHIPDLSICFDWLLWLQLYHCKTLSREFGVCMNDKIENSVVTQCVVNNIDKQNCKLYITPTDSKVEGYIKVDYTCVSPSLLSDYTQRIKFGNDIHGYLWKLPNDTKVFTYVKPWLIEPGYDAIINCLK